MALSQPTSELSSNWLMSRAYNVTSQHGEDGIIEAILEVIPRNNWCVEFGAWDGKTLSNTHYFITRHNYASVLIEANPKKFKDLLKTYGRNHTVIALNRYVGFDKTNSLDAILRETPIATDFDLLSIDIDGNDYHVWEACQEYRPKIVCIEYNPTIANGVEYVQPRNMNVSRGNSITSLCKLAHEKGYELVAATTSNAIFVDACYFDRLNIPDNSVETLRQDLSMVTHIFTGYDGKIILRGDRTVVWHDLPYREKSVQQLPRFFRKFPSRYNVFQKLLFPLYRHFVMKILR